MATAVRRWAPLLSAGPVRCVMLCYGVLLGGHTGTGSVRVSSAAPRPLRGGRDRGAGRLPEAGPELC